MEQLPLTTIYMIVGGVAFLFLVLFIAVKLSPPRHKNKPKDKRLDDTQARQEAINLPEASPPVEENEAVSLTGVITALVVDEKLRLFRPMHVELKKDKNYGRQWEYAPHNALYYLLRKTNGAISVIIPPEILKDSPSELYEAVKTGDDMIEVFGWKDDESNKFKLIYWVVAAIVALFIGLVAMTYRPPGG